MRKFHAISSMHPRYYYTSSLLHKWLYHMTFLFSTNFLGMLWAGSSSCLLLRPVEDHNTTDEKRGPNQCKRRMDCENIENDFGKYVHCRGMIDRLECILRRLEIQCAGVITIFTSNTSFSRYFPGLRSRIPSENRRRSLYGISTLDS